MKKAIIIISVFPFILLSSCVKHIHHRPEIIQESAVPEKEKEKPRPTYQFELTEQERALNTDNEFLRYLETGKYHPNAVRPKKTRSGSVSEKQRKAVTR